MTADRPTILLTRPLAQSRAFAARCRETFGAEIQVLISPVMRIVPVVVEVARNDYGFVILTSANAAPALSEATALKGLDVYCVGGKTAEAVRALGFPTHSADGDADALARLLHADRPRGRGLHIRGEHVAADLAGLLESSGIETDSALGYRQEATQLTDEARLLLQGRSAVIAPIFSPRSAALLSDAAKDATAPIDVVAISPAASRAWDAPLRSLRIAARPDANAVLAEIREALGA